LSLTPPPRRDLNMEDAQEFRGKMQEVHCSTGPPRRKKNTSGGYKGILKKGIHEKSGKKNLVGGEKD